MNSIASVFQWPGTVTARRLPTAARMVLFVGMEPQPALREALAGDGVRCVWAREISSAIANSKAALFDGAVIDVAAIRGSIGTALSELRTTLRCPMIVMAPQRDDIDEIVALECGAHVYLVQPVPPRLLHAYLQAQMRHASPSAKKDLPAAPPGRPPASTDWWLDSVRRELWVGERRAQLTGVQCALMQCLIDARGAVVPRAKLGASLPTLRPPSDRSVDVYVHRLRKRLLEQGLDADAIRSVPSRGYLLDAPRTNDDRTRTALDSGVTAAR